MKVVLLVCQVVQLAVMVVEVRGHAVMVKPAGRSDDVLYCGANFTHVPARNYSCVDTSFNKSLCGEHDTKCRNTTHYKICTAAAYEGWRSVWQRDVPGSKCGVCGDWYHNDTIPSEHEYNGTNGKSGPIIAYREGQLLWTDANVWDPHKGFMQWRICTESRNEVNNQSCFDQNLLYILDNPGHSPWAQIIHNTSNIRLNPNTPQQVDVLTFSRPNNWDLYVTAKLILPLGLVCDRCTIQFNYRSGRTCNNEHQPEFLCRDQETFRTCADVRIVPKDEPVVRLQNIGMSNSTNSQQCLDPSNPDLMHLFMAKCDTNHTGQSVLGGQPWADFGHNYAPIVFELPNHDGECIDVAGGSPNVGAEVCKWTCHFLKHTTDQSKQKWMIIPTANNASEFRIKSLKSTLCITALPNPIKHKDPKDDFQIVQHSCDDPDPNQIWTFLYL